MPYSRPQAAPAWCKATSSSAVVFYQPPVLPFPVGSTWPPWKVGSLFPFGSPPISTDKVSFPYSSSFPTNYRSLALPSTLKHITSASTMLPSSGSTSSTQWREEEQCTSQTRDEGYRVVPRASSLNWVLAFSRLCFVSSQQEGGKLRKCQHHP